MVFKLGQWKECELSPIVYKYMSISFIMWGNGRWKTNYAKRELRKRESVGLISQVFQLVLRLALLVPVSFHRKTRQKCRFDLFHMLWLCIVGFNCLWGGTTVEKWSNSLPPQVHTGSIYVQDNLETTRYKTLPYPFLANDQKKKHIKNNLRILFKLRL